MKLLHVADIHGNLAWCRWLIRAAEDFDLVCIAGDLLDLCEGLPRADRMEEILPLVHAIPAPVVICSGNHDVLPHRSDQPLWFDEIRRAGRWTDGDRFEVGGWKFRCLGWGEPVPISSGGEEVWVTHCPPRGELTSRSRHGVDWGDYEFGDWCKRGRGPAVALCGHVHEPARWHDRLGGSFIFNPGHNPNAAFPNHVVLNLTLGRAFWRGCGQPDEKITVTWGGRVEVTK